MRNIVVTDRAADMIAEVRDFEALCVKKSCLFDLLACIIDNADENGKFGKFDLPMMEAITDYADLLHELSLDTD